MTATGFMRGHPVAFIEGEWRYEDGAVADGSRPCTECGESPTPEGYDACLGCIPGATSACCGHGKRESYVVGPAFHAPANDPHTADNLNAAMLRGRDVQDGLDPERLAEAWGNVMDGRRVEGVRLDSGTTTPDDWAAIIEEYRRLAAPPLHDPVGPDQQAES